jgi:hypothetical protein
MFALFRLLRRFGSLSQLLEVLTAMDDFEAGRPVKARIEYRGTVITPVVTELGKRMQIEVVLP